MTPATSKRLLQICVLIGGCVPIVAGLAGVMMGPQMVADPPFNIQLDSHYRYLSGLLLGIGLSFWSLIPSIEKQKAKFQLLTLIVVMGGFARMVSLLTIGVPNHGMIFGLLMELVIVPLLAFWQNRIAIE